MASSEDEVIGDGEEEVRSTRATRAQTARRGKKTPTRSKVRRGRSAAAAVDISMEVEEQEQMNGSTNENGGSGDQNMVPELDEAPPPSVVQHSLRAGIKLKSVEEQIDTTNSMMEDQLEIMNNQSGDYSQYALSEENEESQNENENSNEVLEGHNEFASDDVSYDASNPPLPDDTSNIEAPENYEAQSKESNNGQTDFASDDFNDDDDDAPKVKDSSKRKLPPDGEYDPSSPTSENETEETPAKKLALAASSTTSKKDAKPALPELEKYWKAVQEDPADFTGWTYLLQYVDQENDVDAAREAYDAFLSHYPYCYGYWRKFADYEKKRGNKEKCEEVFERGLKAIPLSVDLWIHYLNYCRAAHADEEVFLREQYEKALEACGMEFRSDRLWESYIKWETESKRLQNVTGLYDRLLATPTQGYTTHFDSFQEHVSSNPPNKVLSVDEFLSVRQEVIQLLKTYEPPAADDSAPPGEDEDADAPPGEETEQVKADKSDEETTALRERIISMRRKIHKNTVNAVLARWNYEEGIKRPYFHVKPLERCQLKNWKEYLDYEIEQGDTKRTIVLFERCLIACALYEEFWIKFVKYLQSLTDGDWTEKIRDVLRRACTIHHPKKPSLHLFWSEFEEMQKNYPKAAEVLSNIEKVVPCLLQISYRRINLERRRGNLDKACELYEHYINFSKNKTIVNNIAIKYARFCWKITNDIEKAISILRSALEKDPESARLYLQLISMEIERDPMDQEAVLSIIDQFLSRDVDADQKLVFAQRKVEFLEDFGTDILSVQGAHEEFQKILKQAKDKKKKGDADGKNSATSGSLPPTSYPPPNYSQNGTYSSTAPPPAGYQSTPPFPPTTGASQTAAANYNQQYSQAYSQSGDYQNYQNWGYSQPGYSGYNQGWTGYYNY